METIQEIINKPKVLIPLVALILVVIIVLFNVSTLPQSGKVFDDYDTYYGTQTFSEDEYVAFQGSLISAMARVNSWKTAPADGFNAYPVTVAYSVDIPKELSIPYGNKQQIEVFYRIGVSASILGVFLLGLMSGIWLTTRKKAEKEELVMWAKTPVFNQLNEENE
jgi:hypothetical protein